MVKELKEVLHKVEQLEEDEQKQLAKLLQAEISWEAAFKNSQDVLGKLADEALQDFRTGKATQTDW